MGRHDFQPRPGCCNTCLEQIKFKSMQKFPCPSCGNPMRFLQRLKNGNSKNGSYRRRRYRCDACDVEETIHADGQMDVDAIPVLVLDDVNRMFKQEEENRK